MASGKAKQARFGVFELDLRTGELRKGGTRIRLQEQPFVVLKALLEEPGELVRREALQERLWPDDVHVDVDDGLSTAVRRIRIALNDSAKTPRFIETIPKLGYRFIAPVEFIGGSQSSEADPRPGAVGRRRSYLLLAAGLALAALVSVGAFLTERKDPGPPLLKFVLAPGEDVHDPVISPDGNHVAFVTLEDEGALWIRRMRAEEPRKIPNSAGARWPIWSPDSKSVVFQSGDRVLRVDSEPDAAPIHIGKGSRLRSASWSQDGEWLHVGALRMPAGGGDPAPFVKRDGEEFRGLFYPLDPTWLPVPERRLVLLHLPEHNQKPAGIYLVDYGSGDVRFVTAGRDPAWSSSGHIVFQEEGSVPRLRALAFSLETLQTEGESFVIAENATRPSVSNDGKLVYLSGAGAGFQVVMRDRDGQLVRAITPVLNDPQYVGLSPSGEEVAFTALTGDDREIWIARTSKTEGEPRRLTFNDTSEGFFLWSPDEKRMLYRVKDGDQEGETYLVVQTISDGRVERLPADGIPAQWWGDGAKEYLLFANNRKRPWSLDYGESGAGGEFEFQTFRKPPGVYSQLSPEGGLITYLALPEREFFVQPFPSGEGRWQLDSADESIRLPRWSPTAQEIFYLAGDQLRAATYTRDPSFRVTNRQTLFRAEGLGLLGHYDVMPDGEHFVLLDVLRSEMPTLRVTQNWYSEFRDRVSD